MAYLYRLILAIALFAPGLVQSAICTQWTPYQNPTSSQWYEKGTALSIYLANNPSTCNRHTFVSNSGGYAYSYTCGCCENGTSQISLGSRTGDYCQDDLCLIQYKDQPAGSWFWGGTASTMYLCDPAAGSGMTPPYCAVIAQRDISYMVGDLWQSMGPGIYTGTKCDGTGLGTGPMDAAGTVANSPSSTQGSKQTAPACDGYLGEVNGVTTCVAKTELDGIKTTPTTTTSTTSSPEGTSTQTVTKETICEAGACNTTTTTTTITNGGSSTVTNTTATSVGEFCKANPTDKACGGSGGPGLGESESSFGGSCQADFTCSGDAVSCAIARATNKLNCAFAPTDPIRQVYTTAAAAGTPTIPNQNVEISNSLFDTSNAIGGTAAGVSDLAVTVWGQSVSLPLSKVNPYLAMLGNIIVALAFLLAVRILIRG